MPTTKDKNFLSSDEGHLQHHETYSHTECLDGESYVSHGLRFSPSSHVVNCKEVTNCSFLIPTPLSIWLQLLHSKVKIISSPILNLALNITQANGYFSQCMNETWCIQRLRKYLLFFAIEDRHCRVGFTFYKMKDHMERGPLGLSISSHLFTVFLLFSFPRHHIVGIIQ